MMKGLKVKNYNTTLIEKLQKYQPYNQVRWMNMSINLVIILVLILLLNQKTFLIE